jgi:hypothetical protein
MYSATKHVAMSDTMPRQRMNAGQPKSFASLRLQHQTKTIIKWMARWMGSRYVTRLCAVKGKRLLLKRGRRANCPAVHKD